MVADPIISSDTHNKPIEEGTKLSTHSSIATSQARQASGMMLVL